MHKEDLKQDLVLAVFLVYVQRRKCGLVCQVSRVSIDFWDTYCLEELFVLCVSLLQINAF